MGQFLGMTSLLAGVPDAADAQSPSAAHRIVRIPGGDLARALRLFSRQTGRQVAFAPHLVRRKRAAALDGRFDPDIALMRMLAGTGLTWRAVGGGYVLTPALRSIPQRPATSVDPALAIPESRPDITVIGTRLDGGEAGDIRRRSLQSVSVLTDADIRKLPDTSLAEVVRRVPGMQLSVRAGGGIVTIRGLSQTEDRINGRNLSSMVSRGYDIAALPSDIVAGVDVYKTPSASQIEGGIGGVIDFHTRRPFDVDGSAATVTIKGNRGDLDGRVHPIMSGHVSDRRMTAIGEIGLLAGASFQRQDIAQNLFRVDTNLPQVTAAGSAVDAPANAIQRTLRGTKELATGYASAQWRPASSIEITGDALFNRSTPHFVTTTLLASLSGGKVAGRSYDAVTGRGDWTDVPLRASTVHGIGSFDTHQFGLSARYQRDALTILGEASSTRTRFHYVASTLGLRTTAPSIAYAAGQDVPWFTVGGVDPADRARWRVADFSEVLADDRGMEKAYRLDGIYRTGGVIAALKAGARFARRDVAQDFALRTSANPAGLATDGSLVAFAGVRLFGSGYPDSRWIAPAAGALAPDRVGALRTAFGFDPAEPPADPRSGFGAAETVMNGYVEGTIAVPVGRLSVDGNIGLRYARTNLSIASPRVETDAVVDTRVEVDYDDWLPSLNLRTEVARSLFVRLAYSRQISRLSFTLLAPTLTLDFVNAVGFAGNPRLRPLRASQYDAALEWYFGRGGNLYVAGFYKEVRGFVRTLAATEQVDGRSFLIARPINADDGWIGGTELGYAQRFDRLPGLLSGLGIQASYTFIDGFKVRNDAGFRVPIEQMSRHNCTLAASYERGAVTAGVAWIWRSRLAEVTGGDAQGRPLYRDPYGQLDANIDIAVTPGITLTAGILNALQRRTTEYFLTDRYFNQAFIESRRILIGVSAKLGGASP